MRPFPETKAATEFVLTAAIAEILIFREIREILRCSYSFACILTSRKKEEIRKRKREGSLKF
jgi:hypothetical protein